MGTLSETKVTVYIDGMANIFKMDPKLELSELKKKIEAKTNIPVDDQELFEYGGEPLLDFISLKSLRINSDNHLYLYKKSELYEIKISTKEDYDDNNDNYTCLIHESMNISFLVKMIKRKANIKLYGYDRFSLLFNSIKLENSKKVKDYNIKEGSFLVASIAHLNA